MKKPNLIRVVLPTLSLLICQGQISSVQSSSEVVASDVNPNTTNQPHELDKEVTLRHHHEKWLDDAEALIQHQEDIDYYHLKGCPHFKTHEALAKHHITELQEYHSTITKERQWLRENPATYNGTILDDVSQLKRIEHIRNVEKNIMTNDDQIIDEQQAMLAEDAATDGVSVTASSVNETNFLAAAFDGHADMIRILLEKPININVKDKDGFTALMMATDQNHMDVVQILIKKGADVNARENAGNTALSLAADRGYADIADLLIAAGANVNVVNHQGSAPLMVAAFKGHLNVAQRLIKNGALVNAKNNVDITALMAASEEGHADIVSLLLENGADATVKDKNDNSALDTAKSKNRQEIAAILRTASKIPKDSGASWVRYMSPKNGFSLVIPSNFVQGSAQGAVELFAYDPTELRFGQPTSAITAGIGTEPTGKSLEDMALELREGGLKTARQSLSNSQLHDEGISKLKINGMESIREVHSLQYKNYVSKSINYIVRKGDKIYVIGCTAPDNEYVSMEKNCTEVIKSFRF